MKIALSKPLRYQDKEVKELDLVLDDLTGQDLIDVEEDMKRKGLTVNAWEYSRTYLISLAGRAMNIPANALKKLSAKDFTSIINETLTFLAGTASETATPQSSVK